MENSVIEERLTKIETKLAFLEEFLTRLQEEVITRNGEIEKLRAEHNSVKEKLFQLTQELEEVPSRKPPHY
jgi:SlyX protein